jgi:hypothetical protein
MEVAPFIHDGALTFTVTSAGYKYLTLNLWTSIQRLELPWKLCIVCLDDPSFEFFKGQDIPAILFKMPGAFYHSGPAIYGSQPFKKLVAMKLEALRSFVGNKAIAQLIYLDGDIVILGDPLPTIRGHLAEADLWFQCDSGNFDACPEPCPMPCTGVIVANLTEQTRTQLLELFKRQAGTWLMAETDQDYVQARLKSLALTYRTLPRTKFPNGIFLRQPALPDDALLVHFNFLLGRQKEETMRNRGLWFNVGDMH